MRAQIAGIAAGTATLVAVAAGCGTVGRVEESTEATRGKTLFVESCGSCHTLADAGTQGKVGPNLDEAFRYARQDQGDQGFDESTIRDVVRGQIAYPVAEPPTSAPGMPANLVTGADADAVASYVAMVAGVGPATPPAAGGGGGDASAGGEAVFASAGCGSCHALAAAGATGSIGPDLDESKPSLELALDRVTNGQGGMPSFKGQLTDEQIQAVAEFVSQ